MIAYEPDDRLAHRLDPRSKLAFQVGFAVAAVTHVSAAGLLASLGLGLLALRAAGLSPMRVVRTYWMLLAILAIGPLGAGLRVGIPPFAVDPVVASARSVARVVPILLVSGAYTRSTPVRDTRAAIQRTIPGRPGVLLGVGVGLTVRFVPLVRTDVTRLRKAMAARGGDRRSVRERAGRIAVRSVERVLARASALSLALRARCFAYTPTLPALEFGLADVPVLAISILLVASPWL
jgi:biotin transport system permease protein